MQMVKNSLRVLLSIITIHLHVGSFTLSVYNSTSKHSLSWYPFVRFLVLMLDINHTSLSYPGCYQNRFYHFGVKKLLLSSYSRVVVFQLRQSLMSTQLFLGIVITHFYLPDRRPFCHTWIPFIQNLISFCGLFRNVSYDVHHIHTVFRGSCLNRHCSSRNQVFIIICRRRCKLNLGFCWWCIEVICLVNLKNLFFLLCFYK